MRNAVTLGALSVFAFGGGKVFAEQFGSTEGRVCPITVEVSHDVFDIQKTPSVTASTVKSAWVEIPNAHDNPVLKTRATLVDVDREGIAELRDLIENGSEESVADLEQRCQRDAEWLIKKSAVKTVGAGTAGAAIGALAGWGALHTSKKIRESLALDEGRRLVLVPASLLVVGVPAAASLTWAGMTVDEQALENPIAQGYFSDLEDTIRLSEQSLKGYQKQGREFTQWVEQVAQLQEGLTNPESAPDYITILSIADIHSRPCAYERVKLLAVAYDVDFITNGGDEVEWDERESGLLTPPGSCDGVDSPEQVGFKILQVEGNHDDDAVMANLDALSNVMVLDNEIVTMPYDKADGTSDSVRILGIADTRFEGDDPIEGRDEQKKNLLDRLSEAEIMNIARGDYDILLFHDPQLIEELERAGLLPRDIKLVSMGHRHVNKVASTEDGVPLLTTGSSGGAGLRGLNGGGYPSEYSVVYLDPDTKEVVRISLISVTNEGEISIRNVDMTED